MSATERGKSQQIARRDFTRVEVKRSPFSPKFSKLRNGIHKISKDDRQSENGEKINNRDCLPFEDTVVRSPSFLMRRVHSRVAIDGAAPAFFDETCMFLVAVIW